MYRAPRVVPSILFVALLVTLAVGTAESPPGGWQRWIGPTGFSHRFGAAQPLSSGLPCCPGKTAPRAQDPRDLGATAALRVSPEAIRPRAGSSGGWWNLTPTLVLQPAARAGAAIAYDPQNQQVLLFGGANGTIFFGDTWSFEKGAWTRLSPSASPSPRTLANLVCDPITGIVILFGGRNASVAFNDTWTFAGGNWTHLATSVAPPGRSDAGMAFDPSSNETVLFGGANATGSPLGDTWSFDGRNWTGLAIAGAPAGRFGAAFAPDPSLGGILMFGGSKGGALGALADTWVYANASWRQLSPLASPPARYGAASATVPVDSVVLLFGGVEPNGSRYLNDLWQFQGNAWAPVVSAGQPDPRANASMAWDVADGYLLLVGGDAGASAIADSWVFARPISVAPFANELDTDLAHPVQFGATVSGGVPPYLYDWRTSAGPGSPLSLTPGWNTSFSVSGNIVVTLLVGDHVGATGSSNLTVSVELSPTIAVNITSVRTDVGLFAQFAASAAGGVLPRILFWSFSDGYTSSSNPASHRFAMVGNYTASATVRDALGKNASTDLPVSVAALPSSSIRASLATTVSGYPVNFSVAPTGGTGRISVSWQFGDGQGATGASVTHTFARSGQYVVVANLTDRVGGSTLVQSTENVTTMPAPAGPSVLGDLVWIAPALLAAVGIGIGLRRIRAARGRSAEPGLETRGAPAEELPETEILPGGGQQDNQPERRE